MKKLLYAPIIFSLFILFSCSKEESSQENEKNNVWEQLLGKWYSQIPEDGFYEIEFTPEALRFTMSVGTSHARSWEGSSYQIEGDNILSVYRFDEQHKQDAYFKHPFAFSDDGRLWINHLAPSIVTVIGQYPGDRRWYGEVWFGRDKEQEFPENDAVKERLIGTWVSTTPADGYFRIVFDEDDVYYTKEIGMPTESTEQWEGYRIEDGSALRVDRKVPGTEVVSGYRHTLIFQADGTLRIANLQRDDSMIAPAPGDVSAGYHDVIFERAN